MSESQLLLNQTAKQLKHRMQFTNTKLKGLNPLITAALPLLLLLIRLKDQSIQPEPIELRNQILEAITEFEAKAQALDCSPRAILAARYCLCTAIDESVLCTPWGSESVWTQQTLLSIVQKETWGGERFFIILDRMLDEQKTSYPLLELIYLLLSFGYEGKYYNENKAIRDEIRHRLFRVISLYRDHPNKAFPSARADIYDLLHSTSRRINGKTITIATCSILLVLSIFFNIKVSHLADPLLQQLNDISQELGVSHITSYPADEITQ